MGKIPIATSVCGVPIQQAAHAAEAAGIIVNPVYWIARGDRRMQAWSTMVRADFSSCHKQPAAMGTGWGWMIQAASCRFWIPWSEAIICDFMAGLSPRVRGGDLFFWNAYKGWICKVIPVSAVESHPARHRAVHLLAHFKTGTPKATSSFLHCQYERSV